MNSRKQYPKNQTMKNTILLFLLFGFFSCLSQEQKKDDDYTTWEGSIDVDNFHLKLIFKLTEDKCLLEVPAQAVVDYPSLECILCEDSIRIKFAGMIQAKFIGVNQADTLIVGNWIQSGRIFPMNLKRKKEYKRPQNPQTPLPYKAEDISYFNKDKSIKFGGTLTIPTEGTKHPVAILISGSGQQDRDETVFGHKPFLVIADYLTRHGIAVLRVDDRGVGETTGKESLNKATSYDFALDVIAGIEYLKKRTEIMPMKIGLIGHSEGGLIASIIGSTRNDLAFIVSMAGTGVSGKKIILSQIKKSLRRTLSPATVDSIITFETKAIEIILHEKNDKLAEISIFRELMGGWVNKQDTLVRKYFGMKLKDGYQSYNTKELSKRYKHIMSPWYRYLLAYNPEEYLPKVSAPFLAINGEKDTQVLADLNLNGFQHTFEKHDKHNYKIISYPNLNHFFQHCKSGFIEEVEATEETISKEVLNDITTWIKSQLENKNDTP